MLQYLLISAPRSYWVIFTHNIYRTTSQQKRYHTMVQMTTLSHAAALITMILTSSVTSFTTTAIVAQQQQQQQQSAWSLFSSTDGNSLAALKVEVGDTFALKGRYDSVDRWNF